MEPGSPVGSPGASGGSSQLASRPPEPPCVTKRAAPASVRHGALSCLFKFRVTFTAPHPPSWGGGWGLRSWNWKSGRLGARGPRGFPAWRLPPQQLVPRPTKPACPGVHLPPRDRLGLGQASWLRCGCHHSGHHVSGVRGVSRWLSLLCPFLRFNLFGSRPPRPPNISLFRIRSHTHR